MSLGKQFSYLHLCPDFGATLSGLFAIIESYNVGSRRELRTKGNETVPRAEHNRQQCTFLGADGMSFDVANFSDTERLITLLVTFFCATLSALSQKYLPKAQRWLTGHGQDN